MNTVIYKYELEVADWQDVKMPLGGEILSIQLQGAKPTIWVKLAPHQPVGERRLRIVGTGHSFVDALIGDYVGTIQSDGFVWHLFDAGYCA